MPADERDEVVRAAARRSTWTVGRASFTDFFLKEAPGVEFAGAWARRIDDTWNGVPVWIVSADDLIRTKRAAGREQDVIDAHNLERARTDGTRR